MFNKPHSRSWPTNILGKARLVSLKKNETSEYVSFENFRDDENLSNEVNWRMLKNNQISQEKFEISTRQNYDRNLREHQSFLGRFMVNDIVDIIQSNDDGRIFISSNWSGKFKDWVDVELNLYSFKKYMFFDEKEIFASAFTSGIRTVLKGSIEHVLSAERPGDTRFWSCKGEFQVRWTKKELRFFCANEKARNGARNNGFEQDAVFALI
jgi:hypothetical protein